MTPITCPVCNTQYGFTEIPDKCSQCGHHFSYADDKITETIRRNIAEKRSLPKQEEKPTKRTDDVAWGCLAVVVIFALIIAFTPSGSRKTESTTQREGILRVTLSYLSALEDVAWVHFDDNSVYIGFTRRSPDMDMVLRAAALRGNLAIDFGVHVWGVPADERPGSVDRFYRTVTARYGKIEKDKGRYDR